MKYVITGGAGNISKPLTLALLKAGHDVTVISRDENHLKELTNAGAKAAIGSVEDVEFLSKTFTGADAVYTMVPPIWNVEDWKKHIEQIGKNYAAAIKTAGVKHVVNLSSVGAHLPEGCGPVTGLHRVEQALNNLTDANIRHLRASYFYQNLLSNINLIKQIGIIGSNFSFEANRLSIVDPTDIAAVAAEELLQLNFAGHSVRYIASDETSTDAIAEAVGKAINKPDLKWVTFTDEQAYEGAKQAGLPEEIAKNYVEMGNAFNSGKIMEDYWKHHPQQLEKVKLNNFSKTFAAAFNA